MSFAACIQGFTLSLPLLSLLQHCIPVFMHCVPYFSISCTVFLYSLHCISVFLALYFCIPYTVFTLHCSAFCVYLARPAPCFSRRPRYYHRLVLSSPSPTNTKHALQQCCVLNTLCSATSRFTQIQCCARCSVKWTPLEFTWEYSGTMQLSRSLLSPKEIRSPLKVPPTDDWKTQK